MDIAVCSHFAGFIPARIVRVRKALERLAEDYWELVLEHSSLDLLVGNAGQNPKGIQKRRDEHLQHVGDCVVDVLLNVERIDGLV